MKKGATPDDGSAAAVATSLDLIDSTLVALKGRLGGHLVSLTKRIEFGPTWLRTGAAMLQRLPGTRRRLV